MKEKSNNATQNADKFKGYGQSIILQGSVLFLFDSFMYILHTSHGKTLYKLAEKVTFASTENGIGLMLNLQATGVVNHLNFVKFILFAIVSGVASF